jgi:hypothetical protein
VLVTATVPDVPVGTAAIHIETLELPLAFDATELAVTPPMVTPVTVKAPSMKMHATM